MENKETATPRRILKLIEEAFKHYKKKRITTDQLEEYLIQNHGMTPKEARDTWLKAYMQRIMEIEFDIINNQYKRIIRLKTPEKDQYEILG